LERVFPSSSSPCRPSVFPSRFFLDAQRDGDKGGRRRSLDTRPSGRLVETCFYPPIPPIISARLSPRGLRLFAIGSGSSLRPFHEPGSETPPPPSPGSPPRSAGAEALSPPVRPCRGSDRGAAPRRELELGAHPAREGRARRSSFEPQWQPS